MQSRIARFRDVKSTRETQDAVVPDAVTEVLIPRCLYPMMGPEGADTPVLKFATHGPAGFSATICEADPGDGPGLHAHHNTDEIFLVLDGRFRIEWGDKGENSVELERFDTIAVPPRTVRRFVNVSERRAYLLAIVMGGAESIGEVEYTPDVADEVRKRGGEEVLRFLQRAGVGFAAGVDE